MYANIQISKLVVLTTLEIDFPSNRAYYTFIRWRSAGDFTSAEPVSGNPVTEIPVEEARRSP